MQAVLLGHSEDTRFLHFLIDAKLRRNLAQMPIEVEDKA